jgi:hypothetical protein
MTFDPGRVGGLTEILEAVPVQEAIVIGRFSRLGLAMVLVVVAASCGGDDDGGDTLTKQEWTVAADSICVELNEQLEAIPEPQTAEEMVATGAEVAEISRTSLRELRALVPAEQDQEVVNEILDAYEELIDVGEEFLQAAAAANWPEEASEEVAALFDELEQATETAQELSEGYGLQECFLATE